MKRRIRLPRLTSLALALALGGALFAPRVGSAITWYYGCFNCVDRPTAVFPSSYCQAALEGEGWRCGEDTDAFSTYCVIYSDPCLNPDFGGGGGSGSGGGGQCTGGAGGCPAECFSCGGGGGRPRI